MKAKGGGKTDTFLFLLQYFLLDTLFFSNSEKFTKSCNYSLLYVVGFQLCLAPVSTFSLALFLLAALFLVLANLFDIFTFNILLPHSFHMVVGIL